MLRTFQLPRRSKPPTASDPQAAIKEAALAMEHAWRDEFALESLTFDPRLPRPQWDPRARLSDRTLALAQQLLKEDVSPEHFVRRICRAREEYPGGGVLILPPFETFTIEWLPEYRDRLALKQKGRLTEMRCAFEEIRSHTLFLNGPMPRVWLGALLCYGQENQRHKPFFPYLIARMFAKDTKMRFDASDSRWLQELIADLQPNAALLWRRYRDEFVHMAELIPQDFIETAEKLYCEVIGRL